MSTNPIDHTPLARLGRWAHATPQARLRSSGPCSPSASASSPRSSSTRSPGAMWEVKGSDSLAAREVIDEQFGGLSSQSAAVVVHSDSLAVDVAGVPGRRSPRRPRCSRTEPAFGPAMPAQPGMDGKTVMIQAGALVDPTEAVRAAERLHDEIGELSRPTTAATSRWRSPVRRRSGATSTPSTGRA